MQTALIALGVAALAEGAVASEIIDTGSKLANLGISGVLGVCVIMLCLVVWRQYNDQKAVNQEIKESQKASNQESKELNAEVRGLVKETTAAITRNSEVLQDLQNSCHKKS